MSASIFEQRIPTPERPSIVVDRVHETVVELGDAELLAFFTSGSGTPGDNIRILLRPDPEFESSDPMPGLFLWGAFQGRELLVGGADFFFGVGFRMLYPEQQRFRAVGAPDAGNLVWKFRRALWLNKTLLTLPLSSGSDPQADLQTEFRAVEFQGLEVGNKCFDMIEGDFTYRKQIDKDSI